MEFAEKAYWRMLRRLLLIQAVLLSGTGVILFSLQGIEYGLASLYGGLVSLSATLYIGWRFKLATDRAKQGPQFILADVLKGSMVRFLLVIALLAIGMGAFRLQPLAVVIGFGMTQAGYFWGPHTARWGRQ